MLGFVKQPRLMKLVEKLARVHMDRQISDPELRRKVEPGYTIGCKRILPSNNWYPALGRENVELVTDGVAEVRERSIVTGGGEEVEVDAIIFGTGFNVTDMPVARYVRGRAGRTLDECWEGSPRAHLGSTVPGFPNLFMLLGPNTGLGHSSMVYMIESQVAYVMEALSEMRRRGAGTAEVRAEAVRDFNDALDERMEDTVWSTGCSSWYLDDTGRNATLWPDWTFAFRRRAARFDAVRVRARRRRAPQRRAPPRPPPAADLRVQPGERDVDDEARERDQERRGDHRSLDHGEVGVVHAGPDVWNTPGMLKVSSTSTMFVTITGTLTPASVNTGATAAGTACRRSMRRCEMPLASAVRTNSSCRTSRIELFIIRSQTAASGRPSTIHGHDHRAEPAQRALGERHVLERHEADPGDRDAGAEEQQHRQADDVDGRAQEHHRDRLDQP